MKHAQLFLALGMTAWAMPALANSTGVEVATYNAATQSYTIHQNRLMTTFADGGPIERFEIGGTPTDPQLYRMGRDASGFCYSDAVPLRPTTTGFGFEPVFRPSGKCEDNENGDCAAYHDNNPLSVQWSGCVIEPQVFCECKVVNGDHISYAHGICQYTIDWFRWTYQLVIAPAWRP